MSDEVNVPIPQLWWKIDMWGQVAAQGCGDGVDPRVCHCPRAWLVKDTVRCIMACSMNSSAPQTELWCAAKLHQHGPESTVSHLMSESIVAKCLDILSVVFSGIVSFRFTFVSVSCFKIIWLNTATVCLHYNLCWWAHFILWCSRTKVSFSVHSCVKPL